MARGDDRPRDDRPKQDKDWLLGLFELPALWVEPAVRTCRYVNTLVDEIFYDVPGLQAEFARHDAAMLAAGEKPPSRIADLDARLNPEGSLLLIDAATAPYVHRYESVQKWLDSPYPETRAVGIVTITGVGSSALGSAAFGWDVSEALGLPVLAIVPGYGVADMILQGLGGWFGFGLFDFLGAKTVAQEALALAQPEVAKIGRCLSASTPEAVTLADAPVYRHGSGSSDVLHSLLLHSPGQFRMVVGHSKGALQIGNALRSLPPDRTHGLDVVTLGCPVARDAPGGVYRQYLGLFDLLGQLNSWWHRPDVWPLTWHSTNPAFPPEMPAGAYAREVEAA